jgi:hypothetical protein
MTLTLESAPALGRGLKLPEVVMPSVRTIKVLRKFYHNGALLEVGKIITVSEIEAIGYKGSNKAEIVQEAEEVIKKEQPKPEVPKVKESSAKSKKED